MTCHWSSHCVLSYLCFHLCALICVLSYVCSSCALICVLLLCSHIYALICVLSYVCSPDAVSLSRFHPQHCLGSLAGIVACDRTRDRSVQSHKVRMFQKIRLLHVTSRTCEYRVVSQQSQTFYRLQKDGEEAQQMRCQERGPHALLWSKSTIHNLI